MNYLEIPVLASIRFQIVPKIGIALNGGPSIWYRVSKKPDGPAEMNSIDVGADMGLDFLINKNFVIGIESQYGLSEINKDSGQHIINYSLMFGYRF